MPLARSDLADVTDDFAWGVEAASRGDFRAALQRFEAALARAPEHTPALVNRGVALRALGRAEQARACFEAALAQAPEDPDIHNNLGGALHDLGRSDAALAAFRRALALDPDSYEARINYGSTLAEAGRIAEALAAFAEAVAREPQRFEARAKRAETLVDVVRPAEALADAEAAIQLAPARAEGYAALARAYRALGQGEAALEALDAVLARAPSAAAYEARAVMLAEAGRLDEARAAFAAASRRDPRFARAHFGLAAIGPVSDAARAAMERLAAEPEALTASDRLFLLYALAKAYEDAGDFARAFAAATAGGALRRARGAPDEAEEMRRLARAAPGVQPEPADPGDPTEAPIFVFGMPRSGTSLVEQILASHRDVHALGETELFAAEAERADGRALAAAYLARLPEAARAARRFVDKSLGNLLEIGAIRRALPRAKLVHVRRDPMDCCLSCWLTLFSGEMPFAPDLGAIGRYYRAYADLMAAWREALPPGAWHEVQYERLVADPERETRALLAYCGLAWDPRCLAFHETARPVRTASLAAVRRPLYASAVGRAQNFAAYLAPLREGLETPPPVDIL